MIGEGNGEALEHGARRTPRGALGALGALAAAMLRGTVPSSVPTGWSCALRKATSWEDLGACSKGYSHV